MIVIGSGRSRKEETRIRISEDIKAFGGYVDAFNIKGFANWRGSNSEWRGVCVTWGSGFQYSNCGAMYLSYGVRPIEINIYGVVHAALGFSEAVHVKICLEVEGMHRGNSCTPPVMHEA